MNKILIGFISFIFTIIPILTWSQNTTGWTSLIEEENIKLLRKDTTEEVRHYKASFTVYKTLSEAAEFVANPSKYKNWIGSLEEIEKMPEDKDSVDNYRMLLDVSSFFKREGILATHIERDRDRITYQVELDTATQYALDYDPPKYLRMYWELKPLEKNKVEINFSFTGNSRSYGMIIDSVLDKLYDMGMKNLILDLKESISVDFME